VTGFYPSFDATGQKIVLGGSTVRIMNADGTGVPTALASPHVGTVETPSFSPDGKQVLLTEALAAARSRSLYVLTGSTFTLLSGHGVGFGASWAPDGQQIVFAGTRGQLYRMNADGSHRVRLTNGTSDRSPAYSH
jgi:Tol biopolymer transport system component